MGVGVCLSVYVCLVWIPAHWSGNYRVLELSHRGCTGAAQCWRLGRFCALVWCTKHENVSKKYHGSWAQEPNTARRPVTLPLPLPFSTDQCAAVFYSVESPLAILWGDNGDWRSLQRWRLMCKRGHFYDFFLFFLKFKGLTNCHGCQAKVRKKDGHVVFAHSGSAFN